MNRVYDLCQGASEEFANMPLLEQHRVAQNMRKTARLGLPSQPKPTLALAAAMDEYHNEALSKAPKKKQADYGTW